VRLTHIKLAGFKSFVDPTVIPTPSQLVGVVGPNGCGKSNIIDAVRWVLGETRATELRGESMQDVIFSGSGQRKPSGRASVELVFDNSDGRASGQWATFAEISVRRILTRDGTSSYLINNQQVRRRDVHDIFLGTGLGTKGYAIIGQGMITRLIDARPEELRVFLEEAAGVSRYKERRRETESRLSDTRENLLRVDDILSELNTQLSKLELQAAVAAQFRGLETEGKEKQQALWWLKETAAHQDRASAQQKIEQAQLALEAATAQLRSNEAALESRRQAHYQASDAVHRGQAALYEVNAQASSLEAEIRHVIETRDRVQLRKQQLDTQMTDWQAQISHCIDQTETSQANLDEQLAVVEQTRERTEQAHQQWPEIERQVREAAAQRDTLRVALSRLEQDIALTAQRQGDAQRQLQNLDIRRERLTQSRSAVVALDPSRLNQLAGDKVAAEQLLVQAQATLIDLEAQLPKAEQARLAAQLVVQNETQALSRLEARLGAWVKLQEDVQRSGKLEGWLNHHELAALPRLWQKLHIQQGWEAALEAVLHECMTGVEVTQLDWTKGFSEDSPPARLAFYQMPTPSAMPAEAAGFTPLLSLVQTSDAALRNLLQMWLGSLYTAPNLATALAQRHTLPAGAAFVVPSGHRVQLHSVQFYAPDSEQAGMLARQQDIENLQREIKALQLIVDGVRADAARSEVARQQASQALVPARQRASELTQRVHSLQLTFSKLAQEVEQSRVESTRLDDELAEIKDQYETLVIDREQAQEAFEVLDEKLATEQSAFTDAEMKGEDIAAQADQARTLLRDQERQQQEAEFTQRTIQSRMAELQRNQQLASEQFARAKHELDLLDQELATLDAATAQAGLQEALEQRAEREEALNRLRIEMNRLEAELREADEGRLSIEQSLQPQRDQIMALQLQEQAARLAVEQFAEQLDGQAVARGTIEAMINARSVESSQWQKSSWLQSEVQRINRQIESLGAVNLAALDELQSSKERQGFLQSQYADLHEAITTLEDAIQKIDRETRGLLQTTFDAVNGHFGELFPKLFGGGDARLVMTGEEILDAGVQMMAQPPGKRNTSIHLLSGGEKALTATALVFALFKLNPAPFCLLDEVDAALDDANTERYANLVTGMSDQTQFLFISHNKIAMQMAKQLVGVTMQEQGVSRIVAVDIESALQLTADA